MIKLTFVTLVIVGLLTACGGGSDSGSSSGSGGTGGSGGTTYTFQATVVEETQCGGTRSSSNAELLVHDQNWRVTSRHRADASGRITASVVGSSTANMTIIAFRQGQNAEFVVNSFAQYPVTDIGTIRIPGKTAQGCECRMANVLVESPFGALAPAQVELTGFHRPEQSKRAFSFNEVLFEQIEICRVVNGDWPILSAVSDNGTPNAAAGSIKGYDVSAEIKLTLDKSAFALPVNINNGSGSLMETHYTASGAFGFRSRLNSSEVYIFNELAGLDFISIRAADNRLDSVDGGRVWRSRTQRRSFDSPLTQSPVITLPNSDAFQALELFLVNDLPSSNNNYNLGTIQGFNTFYLYAQTTLTDGTLYFQSFIGPLQGRYPDGIVPADYGLDQKFSDNAGSVVSAAVIRYGDSQTYQQYVLDDIARNTLPFKQRMTGKWSTFSSVSVQLTTRP